MSLGDAPKPSTIVRARVLNQTRLGALVLFALTLLYGSQIPKIQLLPVDQFELMSARTMPWVLFVASLLGSIGLWVLNSPQSVPQKKSSPQNRDRRSLGSYRLTDLLTAGLLLILTMLLGPLLTLIGFPVSVVLFLLGGFFILGERRLLVALILAFGCGAFLWLVLSMGLDLYLPRGTLWVHLGILDV